MEVRLFTVSKIKLEKFDFMSSSCFLIFLDIRREKKNWTNKYSEISLSFKEDNNEKKKKFACIAKLKMATLRSIRLFFQ